MKPFFKWSGGKTKEIPTLEKFFPREFETYYEPFLGGGSVWLHLNPKKSIVSDNLKDLINFYFELQNNRDNLITKINELSKSYNEQIKKINPKSKEDFKEISNDFFYSWRNDETRNQAIRFYLLRQLCFGGMLRYNKNGKFNVPYGYYKSLKPLPDAAKIPENSTILNCDWSDAVKTATENDFVFLDPPYTRKFKKYSSDCEFSEKDHIKLANWFKLSSSKNLIVINLDEFTKELYQDYIKYTYEVTYSVKYRDRLSKKDATTIHLVATNF